jgi:NAD(P)-dependent dehydrogenase (short-subunit alcohol dehydrogenase family)
VVVGGGGAGMGAATVEGLTELGAEVHVLDLKDPSTDVASHRAVNLLEPEAVVAAIADIGGPVHALFNCAGLPGAPFSDLDTMLVNFAAPRHLAAACADLMPRGAAIVSISSSGGAGYLARIEHWMPLVQTTDYAAAKAWCEAHPDEIAGGYVPSKEALIVWTIWAAKGYADRGIRLNCISPGPTDTPLMESFEALARNAGFEGLIDLGAQGLGRRATPAEQAWPMIFLNSDAASYIAGENVNVDGGTTSGFMAGSIARPDLFPG